MLNLKLLNLTIFCVNISCLILLSQKVNKLRFKHYTPIKHLTNNDPTYISCDSVTVVTLWLNNSAESSYLEQQNNIDHYRFQSRNICKLSKLWLNKGFKQFVIISRHPVFCHGVVNILRDEIGIDEFNINPFKMDWQLYQLGYDFLYIQDDMVPGNGNCVVSDNFLFSPSEIHQYNNGDNAYLSTASKLYSLGDNFINTPKNWPMHGPQFIHYATLLKCYNLFKQDIVNMNNIRGVNDIVMLEVVGVWEFVNNDNAVYYPGNYFYYTNTNNQLLTKQIPNVTYICLNDGQYLMDDDQFTSSVSWEPEFIDMNIHEYFKSKFLTNKNGLIIIEVGVNQGNFTLKMLMNLNVKRYYLIDVWSPQINYYSVHNKTNSILNTELLITKNKLIEHQHKIIYLMCDSLVAYRNILELADIIYIDSRHDYCHVKKELQIYHKMIKFKGLIAGHDYMNEDNLPSICENGNFILKHVKEAVNEFSNENKYTLKVLNDLNFVFFN